MRRDGAGGVSVLPESPQNGAVVVDTPDDNTVARSKETAKQWLEEIERPLEFETLLELNEVISDLNLGGVSPELEGKIRIVTTVEVNCPETMFATTNNSERSENIEIQAIKNCPITLHTSKPRDWPKKRPRICSKVLISRLRIPVQPQIW